MRSQQEGRESTKKDITELVNGEEQVRNHVSDNILTADEIADILEILEAELE